jgi:hypothetical protein
MSGVKDLNALRQILSDLQQSLVVSETINPSAMYMEIERALFEMGFNFTAIEVPEAGRKGAIELSAVKDDTFVNITVRVTTKEAELDMRVGVQMPTKGGLSSASQVVGEITSFVQTNLGT